MAKLETVQASNARTAFNAVQAGDLVTAIGEFDIAEDNNGTPVATGDVILMVPLPRNHVLVDAIVDTDALAGMTVDVGLTRANDALPDGIDAPGAELMAGASLGAVAVMRADVPGFTRIAPDKEIEQWVALNVTAGSAAVAGKVRVTILYRNSDRTL